MLHLTYTRRDLPQQLVQRDHLTPELYDRAGPVHRYLMDIEGPRPTEAPRVRREIRTWAVAEPEDADARR